MRFCKALILVVLFASSHALASVVTGSGFFVSSSGHVVTNAHVISGVKDVRLRLDSGKVIKASVEKLDLANDLALLKADIDSQPLSLLPSVQVQKGEKVYTLGFPRVMQQGFEAKYTEGVISSFSGKRGAQNQYQISTPVQSGNSGGPLLNEGGQVIGVIVSKLVAEDIENVSYAIKSDYVVPLLRGIAHLDSISQPTKTITEVERSVVLVVGITEEAPAPAATASTPKWLPMPEKAPTQRLPDDTFTLQVQAIDRLFRTIPVYSAKGVTAGASSVLAFSDGLPSEFKESLSSVVRARLSEVVSAYERSHVKYGGSFDDLQVGVSSAVASLSGDGTNAVLVEFSNPAVCGNGGCTTQIYRHISGRWYEIGELFGCSIVKVSKSISNGLRDIQYSGCKSGNTYTYQYDGNGYVTR